VYGSIDEYTLCLEVFTQDRGSAMNAGQNSFNSAGAISWVVGTGFLPQVVLAITIATILYILLISVETIYKSFKAVTGTRVDLLPFTCSADDKPREFEQNPGQGKHVAAD
jgi:hypothetical protein